MQKIIVKTVEVPIHGNEPLILGPFIPTHVGMNHRIASMHIARVLIERAKDHFGVTTDFRRGAWLLPDGSMLDFGNSKGRMDHSDIKQIFPDEIKEQDPEQYIPENDFVRKKFLEAGAIRLVAEGGVLRLLGNLPRLSFQK